MRTKSWMYGLTIAIVITFALLVRYVDTTSRAAGTSDVSAPGLSHSVMQQRPKPTLPLPHILGEKSLMQQVEQLMTTNVPANAYLAYRMIQDCAEFNAQGDRVIYDDTGFPNDNRMVPYRPMKAEEKQRATALCTGMTERERQSRLDYLTIAAKAGVSDAAVAFAQEGPFGDPTALKTRPQDPLVQEWKTGAITQLVRAAESGSDRGALLYLAAGSFQGSDLLEQNPLLAYRYNMAMGMIDVDKFSSNSYIARLFSEKRAELEEMVKDFTPEQRAAELSAARHIADNAKEERVRVSKKTQQ
jgi:hypothetical protein